MLVFVNSGCFPEKGNSISGIFVYEQCQALLKLGHQVVVLYPTYKSIKDVSRFKKETVEVSQYNEFKVFKRKYLFIAPNKAPILSAYMYSLNLKKCYEKAEKEYGKPDVFYSHFSLDAGYGAVYLGKKYNIPVVTLEHYSGYINGKINKRTKYLLNKVINQSKNFLCVSENLKRNIVRLTNTNKAIIILPDMINSIYKYTKKNNSNKVAFFSVGSLIKRKNFDLLIKTFCKAFSKEDNVNLKIAGEGIEKSNLEILINKIYNRKEQITLCGALDKYALLEEYRKCDVFVLLSEKETFGIVYREALGVGRPVISSRNGGIEYNWEDKFGLLINIADENEIVNAFKIMQKSIDEYDLKYISDRTTELYSSDKIGQQIETILIDSMKIARSK